MTEKTKKRMTVIILALALLYLLSGITVAFVMLFGFVKRPAAGWPDPILKLSGGSREAFEKELNESKTWLSGKNPEQVSITSFDNLKLSAHILYAQEQENSKGTVICMHGYHSRAYFEFAGFYQYFYKNGYNVILADQRSHGNSEGKYLTFGIKERYDCRSWIEFANSHFTDRKPVYLCGVSMGASTVLMTLGLELPANVKGVIADCGYTSPAEIIAFCLKNSYHLPPVIYMPFINAVLKTICGYSLYEYSVQEALADNKVPVMFIHGTNDAFVPISMGKTNYQFCKAQKKFIQTDAGHASNFLSSTEIYTDALDEFLGLSNKSRDITNQ